jgi:hypothetical protein
MGIAVLNIRRINMNPLDTLYRVAEEISTVLPYDPKWANGTGYMDGATMLELAPGERAKSFDDLGRLIVLVGTVIGTFVFFQRFSNSGSGVVVSNEPRKAQGLFPDLTSELAPDTVLFYTRGTNLHDHINSWVRVAKSIS